MNEELEEKLRQEGREEVLDWLVSQEFLNYSRVDEIYFKWDWKNERLFIVPWRKQDLD